MLPLADGVLRDGLVWSKSPMEMANFVQECFNCHTVKDNDYVFTKPSSLP